LSNSNSLIVMPNKIKLILSILFISCGFVTDSNDSDRTPDPLVGTWNLNTINYFNNPNCSGDPVDSLDVNSPEDLAELGLEEYQLELTVTIDSYIIIHLVISTTSSDEREEEAMTGFLTDHGYNYYVIYDTEDDDDCDDRKDYTINGNEIEIYLYDCLSSMLSPTGQNVPCQIFNMVKQQ